MGFLLISNRNQTTELGGGEGVGRVISNLVTGTTKKWCNYLSDRSGAPGILENPPGRSKLDKKKKEGGGGKGQSETSIPRRGVRKWVLNRVGKNIAGKLSSQNRENTGEKNVTRANEDRFSGAKRGLRRGQCKRIAYGGGCKGKDPQSARAG